MIVGKSAQDQDDGTLGVRRAEDEAARGVLQSEAMILTRRRAWVVGAVALASSALAVACTDPDPNYGPPEAIRGREIDFGIDGGAAPAPTEGGGGGTPRQLFSPLHASIQGTCTPCHAPAGIGTTFFVGSSEDDSYSIFKAHNYQDLTIPPPKGFFTKGVHTGPALTAAQKTLTMTWSAAELAAGTPATDSGAAPTDAGGQ